MDEYNLPTWEFLAKQLIWDQLHFVNNMKVLDYGSGNGVTASHFSKNNDVVAIEPSKEMILSDSNNTYTQIIGSLDELKQIESNSFDVILCHNVLEYVLERETTVKEFYRLLKPNGRLSIVKHNRAGRVMQMVVLLNDFHHANNLLDGKNSQSNDYGEINYYDEDDLIKWEPKFNLITIYGLRTFWDLQQKQDVQKDLLWQKQMLQIEKRVSHLKQYQEIAFFHHLILKK